MSTATAPAIVCPHCERQLPVGFRFDPPYRYTLTPGLVAVLRKFADAVSRNGRNDVDLEEDTTLTFTERSCITKLRFFALVAKVRVNGQHQPRHWLLTRRGARFLRGLEPVHREVTAQSNHVIDHSLDKVYVAAFANETPWLQTNFPWDVDENNRLIHQPKQVQLAI